MINGKAKIYPPADGSYYIRGNKFFWCQLKKISFSLFLNAKLAEICSMDYLLWYYLCDNIQLRIMFFCEFSFFNVFIFIYCTLCLTILIILSFLVLFWFCSTNFPLSKNYINNHLLFLVLAYFLPQHVPLLTSTETS